jgi:hypothetical protein
MLDSGFTAVEPHHKWFRELATELSGTRPLRVGSSPMSRLDADSMIHSIADPLLAAKVSFRCLTDTCPSSN